MLDVLMDLIFDFGADLVQQRSRFRKTRDEQAGPAPPDKKGPPSPSAQATDARMAIRTSPRRSRRRDGRDNVDVLRVGS